MDSNNGVDFDDVKQSFQSSHFEAAKGPTNQNVASPAMSYDDIFPGLPETMVNAPPEGTMGKWNNKLRVGPRNVTQVLF